MSDTTSRLKLPLLAAAQAQKEMTHNEALVLADLALQAVVLAVGLNAPPTAPAVGQCWIVGGAPTGAWTGQAGAIAGWTIGGWRFVAAFEGMAVWSIGDGRIARRGSGTWAMGSAIAAPVGGATVDAEVRQVVGTVLNTLKLHGLISS